MNESIKVELSGNSHTKVFDPSVDFDAWCKKMEFVLQNRNAMTKKQVRQGIVKLFKEYWPLDAKMQLLVGKVNALLEEGDSLLTCVNKYQVHRGKPK